MDGKFIQQGKATGEQVNLVYRHIQENPGCKPTEISKGLGLGFRCVISAVAHLERCKLVKRKMDHHRSVYLTAVEEQV